jgi:hypothetical protein
MANNELRKRMQAPSGTLARPVFEAENHLAAQALQTWQHYRRQLLQRHNHFLHGWGAFCGLLVVPANDRHRPWAVRVCPGYAISCCGDEIVVPMPTAVDVREYLWRRPLQNGQPAPVAYVGIQYAEERVRPVPVPPLGCGCTETVYQPSRICDSFQVDIVWVLPEIASDAPFDICEKRSASCPDCLEKPYVFLACITLPASEGDPITYNHIDNWSCRRQV